MLDQANKDSSETDKNDEPKKVRKTSLRGRSRTIPEPGTAPVLPDSAVLGTTKVTENGIVHAPLIEPDIPASRAVQEESEDPITTQAVDDIVAKEGDAVLAAEDAAVAEALEANKSKPGVFTRLKNFLAAWWHNPKARWATIVVVLISFLIAGGVPTSRYFVLNSAGVRSRASLRVLDASTGQPLQNVRVRLASQAAKTDAEGKVQFSDVKLGATALVIERRAFAPLTQPLTIGWGSNPLPEVKLMPTGSQYVFQVTDFLSGKPVAKASAVADQDEAQAIADDSGKIVLTLENANNSADITVTIKADTYRDEAMTLDADNKSAQQIHLAPSRKHVFVSKRSGKFDVYSIDVDGKNEKLLLAGTGSERDDMVLVPHPTKDLVAVVSTRDNIRNKDGFLMSSLLIIDTKTGESVNLGQSERMQVVDWIGDRLVYVQIAAGASAANPKRHRLLSYDYPQESKQEIAASNSFNDVVVANGIIYYATSSAYQTETAGFYKINADGTSRQTLLNKEVWNILRTQYDRLSLSVGQDWYEYTLNNPQAGKVSGAPAEPKSRLYRDSSNKQQSLWVDSRDGKGVLLEYNRAGDKKDKVLRTQSGLSNPSFWLNDHYVIYRIQTDQETADYVLNLDGGDPRKIRDVTKTSGIDQWYYYQ